MEHLRTEIAELYKKMEAPETATGTMEVCRLFAMSEVVALP